MSTFTFPFDRSTVRGPIISAIAMRAIDLNRLIKLAEAELESLKEELRADAERAPWRELQTPQGSIRVAAVEPVMGPKKDTKGKLVSLLPLYDGLSGSAFDRIASAETRVTLSDAGKDPVEFAKQIRSFALAERKLVLSLVEEKPGQLRVTLPVGK